MNESKLNRHQLWVEVRYRLVVVMLAGIVLAGFATALRSSVHLGQSPAPRYQAMVTGEYAAGISGWSFGSAWVSGWAENRTDFDCPNLTVWAGWTNYDGDSQGGYIDLGPLGARQRVEWAGYLTDPSSGLPPFRGEPQPNGYTCNWR